MTRASQPSSPGAVALPALCLLALCALAAACVAHASAPPQTRNRPKVADDETPAPTPRPHRTPKPTRRTRADEESPRTAPTPTPTPRKQTPPGTAQPTQAPPAERLPVTFLTGVPQADIFVTLDTGALHRLGKTDAEGKLTVPMPSGTYLVTAGHPAYRTHKKYIEVSAAATAFDFNLTNQPLAAAASAPPPAVAEVINRFLDPKQTDGVTAADWKLVEREAAALYAREPVSRQARALALFARGQLAHLGGDYQEALAAYHAATLALPESALAFYGLGNAWLALKRFPDADAAFRRAVQLNDTLAIAYRGAGDARAQLGQPAEARKYYERARALGYTSVEMSANVARTWMWQRRWAEALAEWREVLKSRPRADVFVAVGDCHAGLKRLAEAAQAYRSAASADPRSAEAQFKYGATAFELRDYAAAVGALGRALELDPAGARINSRRAQELLEKAKRKTR